MEKALHVKEHQVKILITCLLKMVDLAAVLGKDIEEGHKEMDIMRE